MGAGGGGLVDYINHKDERQKVNTKQDLNSEHKERRNVAKYFPPGMLTTRPTRNAISSIDTKPENWQGRGYLTTLTPTQYLSGLVSYFTFQLFRVDNRVNLKRVEMFSIFHSFTLRENQRCEAFFPTC